MMATSRSLTLALRSTARGLLGRCVARLTIWLRRSVFASDHLPHQNSRLCANLKRSCLSTLRSIFWPFTNHSRSHPLPLISLWVTLIGCQPIALQQECRLVRAWCVDLRNALRAATISRTGDQPHGLVQQDFQRAQYHSMAAVLQPESHRPDSEADGNRSFEEIRKYEEWRR